MEAKEVNFLKFLSAPKQLVIPIYQRTYSWNIKECKQLWNDIKKAGSDESISGHFIGSVVYVEKGLYQVSSVAKLLVIDGQQRLTTLSLLISAFCNYLKEKNIETELKSEKLSNYYLINANEEEEDRYKLILTKSDKTALFKLIDNIELTQEDSLKIRQNYEFFKEEIEKLNNIETIYQGLSKLIIIDVSLDREKDNPQLIFESLNSTGLELTQSDLVRNYVMMGLPKKEQEEIYNKYWFLMEKSFRVANKSKLFDWFIRDYLTIKLGRIPTINGIYEEFKKYYNLSIISDVEKTVQEMYQFSKYYINFTLEKESDFDLKRCFEDINELKVDVSYPFILNVYDDFYNNIISKEQFIEILRLIESYVFRRSICGVPTASLNKTFSTLYKRIDKNNYLDSIKAIFVIEESYRRFPDDSEFKKELKVKEIYKFKNRLNYLLRKIENYDRKEIVIVESYTIEHIMPQNEKLSDKWKLDLGENWKDIQKKYLHTIGNLTLTGYNSELSDKSFIEKRDMEGGFKDSPIKINRSLALLETWNENEILTRAEEISNIALNIWNYPKVAEGILEQYKEKTKKTKQIYSIEDHDFLKEGENSRILFDELRKRILNIDSSIYEEFKKLYIAYKSSTNFVDIVARKKGLSLRLNIPFDKIIDPEERCENIEDKGKWGNGDTMFNFEEQKDIDYATKLIKQAFEYIEGEENGN